MLNNIDILTWVLLFVTSFIFDVFTVVYTKAIVQKKGLLAANVSVVLFLLGIYGTINCVSDIHNVIPVAVGYWAGSFVSVYRWRKNKVEQL